MKFFKKVLITIAIIVVIIVIIVLVNKAINKKGYIIILHKSYFLRISNALDSDDPCEVSRFVSKGYSFHP